MKLYDLLKERGTWGSYTYKRGQTEDTPKPMQDPNDNNDVCQRVAEEIKTNYDHLVEKRHIKRLYLQMIVGKVCKFMPQHNVPDLDYLQEYLRKNHRIKVK